MQDVTAQAKGATGGAARPRRVWPRAAMLGRLDDFNLLAGNSGQSVAGAVDATGTGTGSYTLAGVSHTTFRDFLLDGRRALDTLNR